MAKQPYNPVGESYLTEWLGITYPPGTWRTNVALGEVTVPANMVMSSSEARFVVQAWRPVADAVVVLRDQVHLVECKVRDDRGKMEQLLEYDYLFPKTAEYRAEWGKPRRLILLTPKDQGEYQKFLEMYGITVVYYSPPWVLEYLGGLGSRYRRGTGSAAVHTP